MLINFAKTLRLHQEGILNYYSYRISTGPWKARTTRSKP